MTDFPGDGVQCPLPHTDARSVQLAHGSGGKLSAELLQQVFVAGYGQPLLNTSEDLATLPLAGEIVDPQIPAPRVAVTTDAFVVRPLFFPGGDIGQLAVHGTVNDLAVGGARPLYLSAAFVLEEGLPLADLKRIVASMRAACADAGVALVTGDTKVVDRGKGDGVYIATTGIGLVPSGRALSIRNPRPGDQILLSGTLGDHGIAVMSVREGLEFDTLLESDTAPLHGLAEAMLDASPDIRWMRDPTRGGLSSTLNELAQAAAVGIRLRESAIPVRPEVHAACELLGLDPLYVANEGKLVAVVPPDSVEPVLAAMRQHPFGLQAALIGEIVAEHPGLVVLESAIGGERLVNMLSGEQLPRIC